MHDLVRVGIARFTVEDTIEPAVDYHIMRLYLRTGRVAPLHRSTLELLKHDSRPRARLIKLLRETVGEALALTAFYAKVPIPTLNSREWQLGRKICERTRPRCSDVEDAVRDQLALNSSSCPYSGFCRAAADPEWRALREPDHSKSFY